MPMMFNPRNWYWSVAGSANAYASARNIYVPTSDPDYAAWLEANGLTEATPIGSEAEIWHYVKDFQPWWLWDGSTVAQPGEGQYTKVQLQQYNSDVRARKVNGGMTAAGIPVKTDEASRQFIQGARGAAEANPNVVTTWYGSDGNFYAVDAPTAIAMSDAVAAHTNDCYLVFAQVNNDITLNTTTTLAQIDTAYTGL